MNYEAEINYFPVNWAPLKNPRESIPNMIPGEYPPHGDFRLYEQQLHRKVDYILLQNTQFPRGANAASKASLALIEAECTKIYESPHKAVILYKRN